MAIQIVRHALTAVEPEQIIIFFFLSRLPDVEDGRQAVDESSCSVVGGASGVCSQADFANTVMDAAEDVRRLIALRSGVPCATVHKAVGIITKSCGRADPGLSKDLNLLNHAHIALHHFDAAKLREIRQRVVSVFDMNTVADGPQSDTGTNTSTDTSTHTIAVGDSAGSAGS